MMHHIKFIIFFLIASAMYHSAIGQPQQAKITRLNVGEGLSGLSVLNMHLDRESVIWIETENGLDSWDGREFKKTSLPLFFTKNNLYAVNSISSIGEDKTNLYFLYDGKKDFYHIYNKINRTYSSMAYDPPDDFTYNRIITTSNKNAVPWVLYLNNQQMLASSLNGDNSISFNIPNLPGTKVADFLIGTNGIWLRDKYFNIVFQNFNGETRYFQAPKPTTRLNITQVMNAFMEDRKGRLWFSLPGRVGLYRLDPSEEKPILIRNIPNDKLVINAWEDGLGRILIGLSHARQIVHNYMISEDGYHFKKWNFLADISSLPTKIISDDFYKMIYFGTHQGMSIIKFKVPYLNKHRDRPNVSISQYGNIVLYSFPISDHSSILVNEDNESVIHSNNLSDDIEYLPNQLVGQFPIFHKADDIVYSVFRSDNPKHNKLISLSLDGTDINFYDLPIHTASGCKINDSLHIYFGNRDDAMRIILFNRNSGELNELPLERYPLLSNADINFTCYDKINSTLYICTFDQGLLYATLVDGELSQGKVFGIEGLPEKNIISIILDDNRDLVIGTYNGLYIVDPKRKIIKKHFKTNDGLSNNVVVGTVQDHEGRYWVSTFSGLNVIHQEDDRIGCFYKVDGLPHNEFNRNSGHIREDGTIYFGTANGFVTIDSDIYSTYLDSFDLQFSHAQIRTKKLDLEIDTLPIQPIEVSSNGLTHLDLFLGNNFWGATNEVTYHYRIHGLNEAWNKSLDGKIRIDRLPAGEYNIDMKCLSANGAWSRNKINFPINVYTPFFQKTWVRIILLALLISLLGLYYLFVERRRFTQQLKFQKRVSNLELSLLQSQMNPHFIFNALGSIQYYIFNNQRDIAEQYLSKFAGLMRMFLESSRNKFISLEDEIKLLKGYLELEHMRFLDKFKSEVKLELSDSPTNYSLPAMLLQPFVENSINHGLFHSKDEGIITLEFKDDDQYLYCIIDDNGIGRAAAKELRAHSVRKHKSRSTQITEERIEILKEAENMQIEIEYYDYTTEVDDRSGTRVTIKIPIN